MGFVSRGLFIIHERRVKKHVWSRRSKVESTKKAQPLTIALDDRGGGVEE
jgi:hypothetical protein